MSWGKQKFRITGGYGSELDVCEHEKLAKLEGAESTVEKEE